MSERGDGWEQNGGRRRGYRGPDQSAALGQYVPPNSIEAEQSTLGAMLIEREAIDTARRIIRSGEDFYRDTHRVLFDVICTLADRSEPVDLITVQEELKNRDKLESIGGIFYLTSLFETVPTAANVEYYARIVWEQARLRSTIGKSLEVIGMCRGEIDDFGEVMEEVERAIMSATSEARISAATGLRGSREIFDELTDWAELRAENPGMVAGLSTGLADFDRRTSGLQDTDLIIVAARPALGKTSLCLSIAEHVAIKERKAVAIFSLEMSAFQLALRMACSQAMINGFRLKQGYLNEEEWRRFYEYVQVVRNAPIWIDDTTEISPLHARSECRNLQRGLGGSLKRAGSITSPRRGSDGETPSEPTDIGLIIVDYLQLMRSHRKTDNRVQEIGEIARGLKSLAREFGCPVIALSQLSRAVEQRENKRPMLSDLRESGSIEAEADMVCFLYRQAYYDAMKRQDGEEAPDPSKDGKFQIDDTEIIIGKFRNGPTGMVEVGFIPQFAKFVNLEKQKIDDPGPTGY